MISPILQPHTYFFPPCLTFLPPALPACLPALFAFWFEMSEMIKRNTHTHTHPTFSLTSLNWVRVSAWMGKGMGKRGWGMGYVPTRIPKSALMRLGGPVVSFELRLILSRVGHITTLATPSYPSLTTSSFCSHNQLHLFAKLQKKHILYMMHPRKKINIYIYI